MLMKALLLPIMGPISGVVWIAEQIQERTNTEFDAQENLHKRLLSLQLAFDIGELSEEEFEIQEEEILLKIQALEEQARIEAEAEEDEYYEQEPQFTSEVEKDKHLVLLP
ncbi:gas vesicle protein GvpG [Anabaena azotica]|uniref:gas vesicle protein GvpG n=1 Tax=Anabaena azotica TaxID=197653 RepID=UPI0039A75259